MSIQNKSAKRVIFYSMRQAYKKIKAHKRLFKNRKNKIYNKLY